jgi:hypothetical protein
MEKIGKEERIGREEEPWGERAKGRRAMWASYYLLVPCRFD